MKKFLYAMIPVGLLFVTLGFVWETLGPMVRTFALSQIRILSYQNLPAEISAQDFAFRFFPTSAEFIGVKITPKPKMSLGFETIKIKSVKANFDLLQLMAGKIFLSSLILEDVNTAIDLDHFSGEKKKPAQRINLDPMFQILRTTPIYRFALRETRIQLESKKQKLKIDLDDLDLIAFNQKDQLRLEYQLNSTESKLSGGTLPFKSRGEILINSRVLDIRKIEALVDGGHLSLSGQILDLPNVLLNAQGQLQTTIIGDLAKINHLFPEAKSRPELVGIFKAIAQIDFAQNQLLKSKFSIKAKETKIDQFEIGDVFLDGDSRDDVISIPKFTITAESGLAELSQIELKVKNLFNSPEINIKGKINSDYLDLQELLFRLGLGKIPVELTITSEFDCQGPIYPKTEVNCEGKAQGHGLDVKSDVEEKDSIVRINDFSANGQFQISDQDVSYKTDVQIHDYKGESSGKISYKEGFDISYSINNLNLSEINYLAGLKLEGEAKLSGRTQGDSNKGTFFIQMDGHKVYFEDYFLGSPQGLMKYESGILSFNNFVASLPASKYLANVSVDLIKSRIAVDAKSPQFEVTDVIKVFERKVQIPLEITGTGSANIKVYGPLAFNQLTYDLNAEIKKGVIATESFDTLKAQIKALRGEVKFENVFLQKGNNQIAIKGEGHPNGQIKLSAISNKIPLEDLDTLANWGLDFSGHLEAGATVSGHVLNPDAKFKINIGKTTMGELEFAPSSFDLLLNRNAFSGQVSLWGQQLTSEFKFPFKEDQDFLFSAQAKAWNYSPVLSLIGAHQHLHEYKTSLTGDMTFRSAQGGLAKASGQGEISELLFQRGVSSFSNTQPILINMEKGSLSLANFRLVSGPSFFEILGKNSTLENMNFKLTAETQLRIFQILFPFMDDLDGKAKVSMSIGGSLFKPQLLGKASSEDAHIKLKGFPHPFEKINTEIQFSQSKVLLASVKAELAGGIVTGSGEIQIEGPRNIPMNIKVHVEGTSLNIPDKVRTSGNADLLMSGNWFPFLLSGTYFVTTGNFEKEFEDEKSIGQAKQSAYLPKGLTQTSNDPINLDLQIVADKYINIKNSLIEGAVNGNLQIKGAPTNITLLGKLNSSKNTKILFRDKIFEVVAGNIAFTDPKQINPEIYISARSRVSDYDVNLMVQGTAKSPTIRLTSTPPLNEQDIVSLLALGMTTAKLDKSSQSAQEESNTRYQIGTAIIANNPLTKNLQESLGLNLQFTSSYDDTKNVSVQKITLSKKLGEKINISGSSNQDNTAKEIKMKYSLNPNWSTIATYEERSPTDSQTANAPQRSDSILGLDLEFKKEFK